MYLNGFNNTNLNEWKEVQNCAFLLEIICKHTLTLISTKFDFLELQTLLILLTQIKLLKCTCCNCTPTFHPTTVYSDGLLHFSNIRPFSKLRNLANWQLADCNRRINCNHQSPKTGLFKWV